mgnify:CR=1 FL=1
MRFCVAAVDLFGPWFALHAVQANADSGPTAARAAAALLPRAWAAATPPQDLMQVPAVPVIQTRLPQGLHPQDLADAAADRIQLTMPKVAPAGEDSQGGGVPMPKGPLRIADAHWLLRSPTPPNSPFVSLVTVLDLAGCVGLHTDNLPLLAGYTPHLQNLRLTGCNQLLPQDLCKALRLWPKLTHLDLDYAESSVNDEVLATLGGHCPQLRRLYITGASAVTDAAFATDSGLLAGCPALATLKLTGCRDLSDVALRGIALRCSHLEEIILGGVRQLTASALAELLVSCPALTRVKAEMWLDAQPTAIRQRQAESVGELLGPGAAASPAAAAGDAAAVAAATQGEQDPTSYRVVRNIDSALRYLARVLPPGHVASKPLAQLRARRGVTHKPESLMVLHDDHLVKQLARRVGSAAGAHT